MRRIWRLRPSVRMKRSRCSPAGVTLAGLSWRPSRLRPWRSLASCASVTVPETRTRYSLSSFESGPISALASTPSSDRMSRPWESMSSRPRGARLVSRPGIAGLSPISASAVSRRTAGTCPFSGWADTTPTGLFSTTLRLACGEPAAASASTSVWPAWILRPRSLTGSPSMDTRPREIRSSASRREQTPLWASQRLIRWGSASS